MQNNKKIIKKSIAAAKYTIIFRTLTQFVSLIATFLIVRILTEYDYGIYNILYSVISLFSIFLSFGLANTLQRYIPEYYNRGEFKIANNLYRIASIIRLSSNIVALVVILSFWEQIAPIFKIEQYKNYFMLFTIIILLHMQKNLLQICLSSYLLQKFTQGMMCLFVMVKGIGYMIAVIIKANLWYILCIDITAYIVTFTILQFIYIKKIPTNGGSFLEFPQNEKKRLFKYSIFYNFNDVGVGFLSTDFDNFILAAMLNPVAVGAYAICIRICNLFKHILPINYMLEIIRATLFSLHAESESKEVNKFYQLIVKINYLFHIPILFFIAIYGKKIIYTISGGKFIDFANILTGIYFFRVMYGFDVPVNLITQLRERVNIVLYSKLFSVYNIIADIILIKLFGIWGAVIATGTAIFGKNIFIWYFNRAEASFKGMSGFFTKIILFWLVVAAASLAINKCITNDLFSFISGGILFGFCFFIHFKLNFFNNFEKKTFYKIGENNKKIMLMAKWLGNKPA